VNPKHVVAVSGTQEGATPAQLKALGVILRARARELRHGGCMGVDKQADVIAAGLGIPRTVHPGDTPAKQAPCPGAVYLPIRPNLDRNTDIVRAADEVIVVPKEDHEILRSGTWSTWRRAVKAGKPVTVILPSGELR